MVGDFLNSNFLGVIFNWIALQTNPCVGGRDGNDECVLLPDSTEPAEQGAQSSKVHVANE